MRDMPRKLRIVLTEFLQHVTHRGDHGDPIFREAVDKQNYLVSAAYHAATLLIRIVAYVLMDNHVHFALFAPSAEALSRFIQRLHSEHAYRMNAKYNMRGHLFGERFYSASVDDVVALEVVRYVELNPVRARMVQSAADYEFSSARAHVLGVSDPLLGRTWEPLRTLGAYDGWLAELVPDSERRLAAIRHCTRKNVTLTSKLYFGETADG